MKNDGFVPSSSDERNHCAEGLSEDPGIQANKLSAMAETNKESGTGLDSLLRGNDGKADVFELITHQLETQLQKENISGREINNALMDF